jgi:DNA-binding CsgD family transcriptional regulator
MAESFELNRYTRSLLMRMVKRLRQDPGPENWDANDAIQWLVKELLDGLDSRSVSEADGVNLPGERWKDIRGYTGLYQISNFGRVRRWKNNNGKPGWRIKKPGEINGYLIAQLYKDGRAKSRMVHQLVAEHFLRKPKSRQMRFVHHRDEDTQNNRPSNLEWVTHRENKRRSPASVGHLTAVQVRRLRRLYDGGHSISEIARRLGCSYGVARAAAMGITYRSVK